MHSSTTSTAARNAFDLLSPVVRMYGELVVVVSDDTRCFFCCCCWFVVGVFVVFVFVVSASAMVVAVAAAFPNNVSLHVSKTLTTVPPSSSFS